MFVKVFRTSYVVSFLCLLAQMPCIAYAQAIHVPNASFEQGAGDTPSAWTLSSGKGVRSPDEQQDGKRALVVTGSGEDTNWWRSPALPLQPHATYVLRVHARHLGGTQRVATIGPVCSNRTYYNRPVGDWERLTMYFTAPGTIDASNSWLRFGQWHTDGSIVYDNVEVFRVEPVYANVGGLVLGDGERIDGNEYEFDSRWHIANSNHARPLADYASCYFNNTAFMCGPGGEVILKHHLAGRRQLDAVIEVAPAYYYYDALITEVGIDGATWAELGRIESEKSITCPIPANLLPAETVWVRLRCESGTPIGLDYDMGALGIGPYRYRARVDGEPVRGVGRTTFMEIRQADPEVAVRIQEIRLPRLDDSPGVCLALNNRTRGIKRTRMRVDVAQEGRRTVKSIRNIALAPGEQTVEVPCQIDETMQTGASRLWIRLTRGVDYEARTEFFVPHLFRTDYGEVLPGSSAQVGLWTASSGWKVSKTRPVPREKGRAISLSLARNEADAAQLVIRPRDRLCGLTARASNLRGPDGAVIAADAVDILRVLYVPVTIPSDAAGGPGWWPEILPPFREPIDVAPGENQPLWVRVTAPKGIPAGTYRGTIDLTADGYAASVPLQVEVFDFALPDRMTLATTMGLSPWVIQRYHDIKDSADMRAVWDMYLESFSAHHISPGTPAPFDAPRITWPNVKPGGDVDLDALEVEIDWTAYNAAIEKALNEYHFNTFIVPIPGMPSGSILLDSERRGSLLGFPQGSPEYMVLFTDCARKIQEHLREKGWLDEAYVYWFDEPREEQFDFVMEGFELLNEAAPDLRVIMTDPVHPRLIGGPDIWCPMAHEYDPEYTPARRAAGDTFWLYVCNVPTEPYANLFVDHPAAEHRAWLWQTWKYGFEGILYWTTTYWNSSSAYPDPDNPQNPYTDPMGWTGNDGTPLGVRRPLSNSEGRLVYPPEAAADAHPDAPVIEGPVDGIRWEILRDGIEDYEYLAMLKRLLAEHGDRLPARKRIKYEALLEVPEAIAADFITFTKDPTPIEKRRRQIAKAIEALSAMQHEQVPKCLP